MAKIQPSHKEKHSSSVCVRLKTQSTCNTRIGHVKKRTGQPSRP